MKFVALIQGEKKLTHYLKNLPSIPHHKKKYLVYGSTKEDTHKDAKKALEENGFEQVLDIDHHTKDAFLKEYINLIGLLGGKNNSQEWWASNIVSKNRFISNLPTYLHEFLKICQAAQHESFDILILFNPPWTIVSSIKKVLNEKQISHSSFSNQLQISFYLFCGHLRWMLSMNYGLLRILIKKIYAQYHLKAFEKKLSSSHSYYVIRSTIADHSFSDDGNYLDLFFGSLIKHLQNKKNILMIAKIVGNYKYCISNIKKNEYPLILPYELFLSFRDIFSSFFKLLFPYKHHYKSLFFGYDVSDILQNEWRRTYNGHIPYDQFLNYAAIKNLIKKIQIETFLLTYENIPWEKMCIMALRKFSPQTHILGYQHAMVSPACTNVFLSHFERDIMPLPDRILTTGETTKKIMEQYGTFKEGMLNASCGLRFEALFSMPMSKRTKSRNILVILQDLPQIFKIVHYVIHHLGNHDPFHITLRPQPTFAKNYFQNIDPSLLKTITNLSISKRKFIRNDIEDSDIIIYWESMVALEALWMGKPLIHFDMGTCLNYDPLFECHDLKWITSEKNSLVKIIDEIYSLDDVTFNRHQETARTYLKQYIHPITEDNLRKFVN